jgi:multiple antibiotic resistance protein
VEQFLSIALTLLLVMDPVGNVPFYLAATAHVAPERRQRVIARECLIALGILVVWLFVGGKLLDLLGISEEALSAGGGLVLLMIGIRMVFPSPTTSLSEPVTVEDEPLIVPMAVPYFVGPSVMATEAIFMRQYEDQWLMLLGAAAACWVVASTILMCSTLLQRLLGNKVLAAFERLMGMLLIVMSTQMLLDGVQAYFG